MASPDGRPCVEFWEQPSALGSGISILTYIEYMLSISSVLTRTSSELPFCSIDNIILIIPIPSIRLNHWGWSFSFSLPFLLSSEPSFGITSLCFTYHFEWFSVMRVRRVRRLESEVE